MDGEKVVKIFGEEHKVKCRVASMDSFSAHADRKDLLQYISINKPERLKNVFLIHGELDQMESLRNALRSKGYPNVHIPAEAEVFEV
jgi:metallo-beta-lactamase family protein